MALKMPEITEELFSLFEKNGNRLIYEEIYFTRRKFLTVIGLQALLEKQDNGNVTDETLQKLIEIINEICEEECWALPAHLSRKNKDWQITIDLFAAETAQTLAELADRLKEDLPDEFYLQIVEHVERHVLQPFFASADYGWEKSDHNWNAVCTGSIGSACLHLREKSEETDACLQRICDSLIYYIDGFADDGTCMEGCGYFTYGMSYFVNFAQELYEYTEGKTDLLCGDWEHFRAGKQDKRSRIAAFQSKCFFDDGRTVNFSDGNSRDKFRVGLNTALKNHFSQVQIPDMKQAAGLLDDNCYRFVFRKMDLVETENYLNKLSTVGGAMEACTVTNCHVLHDAQWCIVNAKNGVGMACKGGHNGEPHNHNDIGHFIYETQGIILFADLGAGEYTRDYFSEGRYDILCNNSLGHSVPLIDGQGQCAGKEFRCSKFETYESPEACGVDLDLTGAYTEGVLEHFQRKLQFSLNDGRLKVCDEFVWPEAGCGKVTENLITQIMPVLEKDRILLNSGAVTAALVIEGINPEQEVCVKKYIHSNHYGQPENVYAIQWNVIAKEKKTSCCFEINVL